ncbi:enoyl-CoA hydratase/isomerase [Thecamonas trahens ATCC 50062]|uniref:Enoyl-CoA hydratase/isomerase n=1 Tax=Thecamonas trahens ATCC 50062 TaxID=461836 RepID=A0A0L0DA76_THETB|nr:enoyl-CoA hydratase/isomerase [Thecamonas trahens ATCC 50062]KNC49259.1 enoyl-CoA hydratase/isomerase [Thecamonas trahens ATCC 50062]|eukprot:XP_013757973.1 enoyl-CoA hydratase/isomerase [Thecamonas trahens ATCC 50062]
MAATAVDGQAAEAGQVAVVVTVADGVVTIRLNRPKKGNALTPAAVEALRAAVAAAGDDTAVHAVVVTGTGKYFCTGMDLSAGNQEAMRAKAGRADGRDGAGGGKGVADFIGVFEELATLAKPTLAVLNGPALGGGVGLAFACDLRVGKADDYIAFTEVKRGLVPAMISTYIVPQLGPFFSRELMLTGRRTSLQRLYEMGAMTKVAESEAGVELLVATLMDELRTSAPAAMAATKKLIGFVATHPHAEAMAEAVGVFKASLRSPETLHGLEAWRKRQAPDWKPFRLGSKL